ncbi:MAG: hypothetical protein M3R15_32325 [Acidobacteriota bacterium]|nr:hypothetical protein [Acidobacteriota bacterium]
MTTPLQSRFVISVILGLLLLSWTFGQNPVDANLPSIQQAGFEPVIPILARKTGVPVLVPSSLPYDREEVEQFFCTVTSLTHDEYEVTIGFSVDCGGGNACRIGSFTGKQSQGRRITGTDDFLFEAKRARRVKLSGGIVGYFVDATCGANCNDSKVYWKQGGYEYMVGLKAEKVSQVVKLANSAINRGRNLISP